MCDPADSSQLKEWLFPPEDLELCRSRANRVARKYLDAQRDEQETEDAINNNTKYGNVPVECFARHFIANKITFQSEDDGPLQTSDGRTFLTPDEESLLVSFYASKLPSLIGPMAQLPRLRREPKVPATAAMLLRRFYLSNSVMIHDPKTVMVSAAFLASKVEDAMTDVRYLEEGTNLMNAPVPLSEIIPAEIHLLSGVNFALLCFHPYKAVLAITEDLRTYLKSERGRTLVQFSDGSDRLIVGQDLKPMHDAAQAIVNDVVVSDIPMLYTPGQIGLAALMVANDQQEGKEGVPQIDIIGYLSQRFETANINKMSFLLNEICGKLQELKEGKYGCGNYNLDMQVLKGIHKKLKKVRLWGAKDKKKKRKKEEGEDGPETKKARTS
ncbi:cyclin-like protein [Nitzschia inconspicua]|uniref:Cyclin-like protein n=1 Tax=Nitzschia inconspicua TaxID=303405 RepID=A0A9K3PIU1_9STRA|nr:cyclin-like protein [Nitzschia inconspicua]